MDETQLAATVHACRALITERFPDDEAHGAAAMLLDDGTILTGTSPEALNSAVQVCHEIEPYCAAFRLGRSVIASVCLHREPSGRTLVLSPCGVCRERLATHGPDVLVAVADVKDSTRVVWRSLREALPDYWLTVFPDEIDATWTTQPTVRRGRPPVARRAHSDTRLPTTEHEVAELSAAVAQACARAPWVRTAFLCRVRREFHDDHPVETFLGTFVITDSPAEKLRDPTSRQLLASLPESLREGGIGVIWESAVPNVEPLGIQVYQRSAIPQSM